MRFYRDDNLEVRKVTTGPYDNNTYILVCLATGESLVIDTPAEPEKVLAETRGTRVKTILITHSHGDHTAGLRAVQEATRAPVGVHPSDAPGLPRPHDFLLHGGAELKVSGITLTVLHTPGHTPGSVCFLTGKHLFAGDTLFPGGPGRSRSPQDFRQIVESITRKLYVLPDETVVCPGHGPETNIGESKREYAVFCQRPHPQDLCGDVLWLSS